MTAANCLKHKLKCASSAVLPHRGLKGGALKAKSILSPTSTCDINQPRGSHQWAFKEDYSQMAAGNDPGVQRVALIGPSCVLRLQDALCRLFSPGRSHTFTCVECLHTAPCKRWESFLAKASPQL